MLFDPKKTPDLSEPSLRGLIYLLRHREHWPEDFQWFFPSCHRCAMGLFFEHWRNVAKGGLMRNIIAQKINIPVEVAAHAFCVNSNHGNPLWDCPQTQVTPEMVADRLEEWADANER